MKKITIAILIIQTIIIIALSIIIINQKEVSSGIQKTNQEQSINNTNYPLLSPRITSGVLKPKTNLLLQYAPLKQQITDIISAQEGTVSIQITNLRTSASMQINPEQEYYPASLNKLPLIIAIMKKVEAGKLQFTTPILIDQETKDTSRGIGMADFTSIPLQTMIQLDLQFSDNTAHTSLLNYVTEEEIQQILTETDYFQYIQNPEHLTEQNPQIKARSLYPIFSGLYLSSSLEANNSQLILTHLSNTTFQINSFTSYAKNITIAQKYGSAPFEQHQYFHSCGIMYIPNNPTYYCILTKDLEPKEAANLIGKIIDQTYLFSMNITNQNLN